MKPLNLRKNEHVLSHMQNLVNRYVCMYTEVHVDTVCHEEKRRKATQKERRKRGLDTSYDTDIKLIGFPVLILSWSFLWWTSV